MSNNERSNYPQHEQVATHEKMNASEVEEFKVDFVARCNRNKPIIEEVIEEIIIEKQLNKYSRKVSSTTIDVYDVLVAFEVHNPAVAHAVKKLLASGQRGYKPVIQDLQEAIEAIQRAIEIESGI